MCVRERGGRKKEGGRERGEGGRGSEIDGERERKKERGRKTLLAWIYTKTERIFKICSHHQT